MRHVFIHCQLNGKTATEKKGGKINFYNCWGLCEHQNQQKNCRNTAQIGIMWDFWVPERKLQEIKTGALWPVSLKYTEWFLRFLRFLCPSQMSQTSEFTSHYPWHLATVTPLYVSKENRSFFAQLAPSRGSPVWLYLYPCNPPEYPMLWLKLAIVWDFRPPHL